VIQRSDRDVPLWSTFTCEQPSWVSFSLARGGRLLGVRCNERTRQFKKFTAFSPDNRRLVPIWEVLTAKLETWPSPSRAIPRHLDLRNPTKRANNCARIASQPRLPLLPSRPGAHAQALRLVARRRTARRSPELLSKRLRAAYSGVQAAHQA
jgi:hypothetical protein